MNHRLQPVSRLTLVFILAVTVSGSILTYFSINSISNLKELTEKRILEEEREIAAQLTQIMQQEIEQVTSIYNQKIDPSRKFIDSLRKIAIEHDFIEQGFLLQDNRNFLVPNFSEIPEHSNNIDRPAAYKSAFGRGESAEFREQDFITAEAHYQVALRYGKNAADSAKAMNAVARIMVKSGETENALEQYKTILAKFSDTTDEYGIPYFNFAMHQFVTLHDPAGAVQVLESATQCLGEMENGKIPLTWQTEGLLTQILDWTQTCQLAEDVSQIYQLTSRIQQQMNFVHRWRNEILAIAKNENQNNNQQIANAFRVLNSYSESPKELLLIKNEDYFTFGFLINGSELFQSALKQVSANNYSFDYSVEFPSAYSNNHQPELSYTALLNPYFPRQAVQIRLADKEAIQRIIRKRSWIYGGASTLLLVAMLLGVYLILRDIAREKRLAQLRADFISNVTHELKTPLTSIFMFTESLLLGRVKPGNEKNEYLSVILKESERLKRMISNILEFSKMEKGKTEYFFTETNLAALVNSALQEMDYWLEKEHFEVNSELNESMVISVDAEKLKQAFLNLISNAVKYSGNIKKLDVKLKQTTKEVVIEFIDFGIGIPEKQLPRIFEKFYRVDPNEGSSGTGLGLTVVKEIVEAHGGTVNIESQVGKGSKFSIILPKNNANK